jgi:Holliday junction resolvasome RuvABC ATP-dependent DNA helicase subunit
MVDFSSGEDDELDAALILAGFVEHTPRGRYCFQTTYLNICAE